MDMALSVVLFLVQSAVMVGNGMSQRLSASQQALMEFQGT